MIYYIHTNPQKHGLARDFREYPHSSYHAMLSSAPTKLERAYLLDWFGGVDGYELFHREAIGNADVTLEMEGYI